MDRADAAAALSSARASAAAAESETRHSLAEEALCASDERLAAVMAKHDQFQAKLKSRRMRRGASVTVRARPEDPDVGFEECTDALLAMELKEAAADVESKMRDVEMTKLRDDIEVAKEMLECAEAFNQTLAEDMARLWRRRRKVDES